MTRSQKQQHRRAPVVTTNWTDTSPIIDSLATGLSTNLARKLRISAASCLYPHDQTRIFFLPLSFSALSAEKKNKKQTPVAEPSILPFSSSQELVDHHHNHPSSTTRDDIELHVILRTGGTRALVSSNFYHK